MALIKSFRELDVYKRSIAEARDIFELTKTFPRDERFSLTDQIRRSSRAVAAMIAEAWARRRYIAAFINKIDEALGEASETQAWLDHALECEYINEREYKDADAAWQHVGAMLNKMMQKAGSFCG